jgi:hypothetical protein
MLFVALVVFALLQLSSFFQPHHSLQNLEPYPDGLLYSLSAHNLAQGRGMYLSYADSSLPHWVPPLYTLTLTLGYLVSAEPTTFVLVNTLLALATISLIYLITLRTTKNQAAALLGTGAYLAHAYIWWLPSLPMSENLSLFLFVAGIASLTIFNKPPLLKLLTTGIIAGALVFTRYAALGPALGLVLSALGANYRSLSKQQLLILGGLALLGTGVFSLAVSNPLTLVVAMLTTHAGAENTFYSLGFITPNLWQFAGSLVGRAAPFLWQTTPLSSIFLSVWLVFSSGLAKKFVALRSETRLLTVLFLAQLPLQLIFYVADSRYIIYSLPLIALAVGWSFTLLSKRVVARILLPFFVVLIGLHTLTQLGLFKEVIASNLFGRSTAWQVEAIRQFDQVFEQEQLSDSRSNFAITTSTGATDRVGSNILADKQIFLITALPPFLVDAYTTGDYQVLPLSVHQEFLAKGEWVWGSATDPERWLSSPPELRNPHYNTESLYLLFDNLLLENNTLYISNAYITHLRSVTADYQALNSRYSFEKISTGCQEACNLLQLTQKISE